MFSPFSYFRFLKILHEQILIVTFLDVIRVQSVSYNFSVAYSIAPMSEL
jgi:hypothetical protein